MATLLRAWKDFSRANTRYQQFGQNYDTSTFGGATACTHACLQRLVKAKTGNHYTQDQISRIATYPWPKDNPGKRGMYSGGRDDEVGKVIDHFDLPYKLQFNLPWSQVQEAMELGPVLIGIRYGYWPEWKGYRYYGHAADGRPGGYAFRHGKSQLTGFENGYHATLLLGERTVLGVRRTIANEPNHGSAARKEKPDFDSVRSSYAKRAYEQYGFEGRALLAWTPTRTFRPKGY